MTSFRKFLSLIAALAKITLSTPASCVFLNTVNISNTATYLQSLRSNLLTIF